MLFLFLKKSLPCYRVIIDTHAKNTYSLEFMELLSFRQLVKIALF
ncbi:hypothetical protein AB751O23_AD_00430 [Chlamydiales bacterium SCGC AB-751-O23]|nr:hypothetical protein AB751O23_AD_00430 [Chlamydiales bacterium SCGC AB-751-O23]